MKYALLIFALMISSQSALASVNSGENADPNMTSGRVYAEAKKTGACAYSDQGTAQDARLIRANQAAPASQDRSRTAFSRSTRSAI